jgi:signal transduction histidine kinase
MDLFEDLDDAQLGRWAEVAQPRAMAAGEMLVEQGELLDCFFLLLDGQIRATFVEAGREEPRMTHQAPTWMGAIPVLTEQPIALRHVCATDCRVACVPADAFLELVLSQRPVHRRILRQFGPVISRIEATEQSRERLAALGTMAAGLAHELNNPAAAAKRAASDMVEALEAVANVLREFVDAGIEREDAARILALHDTVMAGADGRDAVDALDAADREDELLEQLEALGVAEPWRLAAPLAAAGADAATVAQVAELAGPAAGAALGWTAASLTARSLASELRESAARISSLVGAVKSYAYMDRGEVVEADLHEGLETTLVVLGHKLKHTAIEVVRDYDRGLPKLMVHGGELNQVWTNLLDNAIAALGDAGTITLRTRRENNCAVVEIEDDGPGIPEDVVDRIFEPFFTTKGVGSGTGLGLDTARRIVVDHHQGSLTVDSEPGSTIFHVWLPLP